MVFGVVPVPASLAGVVVPLSSSRVLYQIMIHVVGFVLVALLVSYLERVPAHRPLPAPGGDGAAPSSSSP